MWLPIATGKGATHTLPLIFRVIYWRIDMKYNLKGKKFGKLTVLEKAGVDNSRYVIWKCKCDCGNETIVRSSHLVRGDTKSCGCINYTANGFSDNRIYRIWKGIISRCYNKNSTSYRRYGKKGITICNEWKNNFMSFYNWSLNNGYKDNLSIDRINNKGNYEPNNCRWATAEEQANNTSQNVFISFNGEKLTIAQWAHKIGIQPSVFHDRLKRNGICEKIFHKNMFDF